MNIETLLGLYAREHLCSGKVIARGRNEIAIANLVKVIGKKHLQSVDIKLCRDYAKARGVAPATVRRELVVLKAAFNHAWKWKHIRKDDIPYIELPKEPPPKDVWLTQEELKRLHEAADDQCKDFIEVAYYTAGRKTAVLRLKPEQINFENNIVDLNPIGMKQSNKRRPKVPIDARLLPTLARLCKNAERGYLFPQHRFIERSLQRAVKGAGITKAFSPHVLRHSRATHLLMKGVDPYAVAQLLGDNLSTVMKVYGHHCPNYLLEAMNKASL